MLIKYIRPTLWIILITSCYTSVITNSWKSQALPAKPYSKILVVALVKKEDRFLRESIENHLVGDLSERGFTAISSLKEYGPTSFEGLTESSVLNKIEKKIKNKEPLTNIELEIWNAFEIRRKK